MQLIGLFPALNGKHCTTSDEHVQCKPQTQTKSWFQDPLSSSSSLDGQSPPRTNINAAVLRHVTTTAITSSSAASPTCICPAAWVIATYPPTQTALIGDSTLVCLTRTDAYCSSPARLLSPTPVKSIVRLFLIDSRSIVPVDSD